MTTKKLIDTSKQPEYIDDPRWLWNAIAGYGLFVARLNNGEWMVGKAAKIYRMNILDDHYVDPELTISNSLSYAVWCEIRKQGYE